MYLVRRNSRPLIMGRNGVVCANHPLATSAGFDILYAGGNAFDAAAATALTLAVVEPMMSGLGGDGIYHAFIASSGKALVFNGTGAAPRSATPGGISPDGVPSQGPRSVSTPGALAGLAAMHAESRLPPLATFIPAGDRSRQEWFRGDPHLLSLCSGNRGIASWE